MVDRSSYKDMSPLAALILNFEASAPLSEYSTKLFGAVMSLSVAETDKSEPPVGWWLSISLSNDAWLNIGPLSFASVISSSIEPCIV